MQLYFHLDETNSSNKKIQLLVDYLHSAAPVDAIWVVYFFAGNRFKRLISSRLLRKWVRDQYDIPKWLFDEAMVAVGDTGETISLLIDTYRQESSSELSEWALHTWVEKIQDLRYLDEYDQKVTVQYWWKNLDQESIFILNKLLTGAFRVGVSKQTIAKAVAEAFSLKKTTVLRRMMGNWEPSVAFFNELTAAGSTELDISAPYPYFLASPLEQHLEDLGAVEEWYVEWKWDGFRAQLIKRQDSIFLWSRGEELINPSFPELIAAADQLPNGLVLDGEVLAYYQGQPLAFSVLQRRIGRQDVTETILKEAPVILMLYDILEYQGQDIRDLPQQQRRSYLDELTGSLPSLFKLSPLLSVGSWDDARAYWDTARTELAEGLMLKRRSAPYQVGRKRGDWYKYKVDPLSLDVVLIYAQSGSGRRANLFTAYTFAVWSDDAQTLVPVGRAYSGLTDDEIRDLDSWIRSHTTDRFGPVRSVDPVQVFELGFDGIMTNERTKSGISLRFPRMLRWRHDKPVEEADSLSTARALLRYEGLTEIKRNYSLDDFF